jgi:hypothetical protein
LRRMAARAHNRRPVTLWVRVRAVRIVLGVMALTIAGLVLPASAATAAPSPAGASIAAACILALAVPVTVGWGCTRGDPLLEAVSSQPVPALDLALATLAVGITAAAAVGLQFVGIAPAGIIAARAALVYLGLMLAAYRVGGWRIASLTPAIYLLVVIVMGRGEDIRHPALWAWIAADSGDGWSWLLTFAVLGTGLVAYGLHAPRRIIRPGDE